MIRYITPEPGSIDQRQCNGCSVCMLSCPVWRQRHEPALTFCGRTRARIGGAALPELANSALACILCGSCQPLCPMGIRTQQSTLALRQSLAEQGLMPALDVKNNGGGRKHQAAKQIVLPGPALVRRPDLLDSVLRLVTTTGTPAVCAGDQGDDIALGLEAGSLHDMRFREFAEQFTGASELIVADGLLFNLLHAVLSPAVRVLPVGAALIRNPRVRAGITAGDFYMIETRAFNAHRNDVLPLYDSLRRERNCFMNLDLQRVATPTGASSYQHRQGLPAVVSIRSQVEWLLEGRRAERVVVEHLDDAAAFEQHTSLPVVQLAEVAAHD